MMNPASSIRQPRARGTREKSRRTGAHWGPAPPRVSAASRTSARTTDLGRAGLCCGRAVARSGRAAFIMFLLSSGLIELERPGPGRREDAGRCDT
ncbi:hypothetical protein K523DRAFT_138441 [Schizophyllum commune Tattone D]|nr:hypothetical protein K523DRAFT_138441 [Schizophyllum commune Tattone D]